MGGNRPCLSSKLHGTFSLGNVLFGLGQHGQAAERYRQAVELDHNFVEAWSNLGNILLDAPAVG
jgi:hypothetical protein